MGLPVVPATSQLAPRRGDIVRMDSCESVDAGSAITRVVLGFGSGASDLKTAVEGSLLTERGLRRLGSGAVDSGGGATQATEVAACLCTLSAQGAPVLPSTRSTGCLPEAAAAIAPGNAAHTTERAHT
jgi:hypothetical protein